MKLSSLTTPAMLLEMAAKKVCPVCGHGMVNFHFYYKGSFKCKSTSLAAPDLAAAKQAAASLVAAGYPPTLAGLDAQKAGIAPGSMSATPPASTKTKSTPKTPSATQAPTPAAPTVQYQGQQSKIAKWLDEHEVVGYTINDDNTVSLKGDLDLHGLRYDRLPVTFKSIDGDVSIAGGLLSSFDGFPTKLNGSLHLTSITLESLKGCPTEIAGDLFLREITLKGAGLFKDANIQSIGGDLSISHPKGAMTNFDGFPKTIGGGLHLKDGAGTDLTSFKGTLESIGGMMECSGLDLLKSFHGIPSIGGNVLFNSCGARDLSGFGSVGGKIQINFKKPASTQGCPKNLKGLRLSGGIVENGLDGLTGVSIDGDLVLEPTKQNRDGTAAFPLELFKGIHKKISQLNGKLTVPIAFSSYDYNVHKQSAHVFPGVSHLLGIVKIKGIKSVDLLGASANTAPELKQLQNQFNQCINGTTDIHDLQEWMIDAGYTQMAKL